MIPDKFLSILVILLLFSTLFIQCAHKSDSNQDILVQAKKIIDKHEQARQRRYEQIETSFNKNPNAEDAFSLMDFYFGEKKYDKALKYATFCLEALPQVLLHAEDKKKEYAYFKIKLVIAQIYHEKNQDELAKKHLLSALEEKTNFTDEDFNTVRLYQIDHLLPLSEWCRILNYSGNEGLSE